MLLVMTSAVDPTVQLTVSMFVFSVWRSVTYGPTKVTASFKKKATSLPRVLARGVQTSFAVQCYRLSSLRSPI